MACSAVRERLTERERAARYDKKGLWLELQEREGRTEQAAWLLSVLLDESRTQKLVSRANCLVELYM